MRKDSALVQLNRKSIRAGWSVLDYGRTRTGCRLNAIELADRNV